MPNPSSRDSDPPNLEGRVLLGRFRVERALGRGGMGEVLLATDTLLHRPVALKRLRADGEDRGGRRRAILKEARRASQINDRHIASIYDVLDLEDDVLIVMEYVEGVTLRGRMTQPISLDEFWNLATQCADAMAAAHSHGVIHHDLKPENLMLTREGEIKVLDFGIAKRSLTALEVATTTTEIGAPTVAGTPQYMAPEVNLEGTADERADIFSLGVVFYELLTGGNPFAGTTYASILARVVHTVPPPVLEVNPVADGELSRIVGRMMAKSPDDRYPSSVELVSDLKAARGGAGAVPAFDPIPTQARVRRPMAWRWPASLTAGAAAIAVALVLWRGTAAPVLPRDLNLAILAPATTGADSEFVAYAVGFVDALGSRIRRHTASSGFQMSTLKSAIDEKVNTASAARKLLGANVALIPALEQHADVLRGRFSLVDTEHERVIATRVVELPSEQPFAFYDRAYREVVQMLRVPPDGRDAPADLGMRGAGTMRFQLQGRGRLCVAQSREDVERAIQDFEVACRTEPEAALARAGLASAELRASRFGAGPAALARAEAAARMAVALDDHSSDTHEVLADVLSAQRNYDGALSELALAASLDSTDDYILHRIGRTYARLGQPEREIETYRAAIRRLPHAWRPHWWMAAAEFRSGHVEESIAAYQEMIRRAPLFYEGYSSLGAVLVLRGDYAPAIEHLNHAIALCPTRAAFDNLGTAYFNTGKSEEAVDAYNQSFQFGEASYQSWLNLGEAYFWLRGQKPQALEAYTQCVRLGREEMQNRAQQGRPIDAGIPATLSTVFPKLGEPDSARAYLAVALAADSANSMVAFSAALAFWQLDDRERALVWLQKSVAGGYPTAWLEDSPVFDEWRQVAQFQAIVGKQDPAPQPAASRQ